MALKAMFYQKDANSIPDTKNILELALKLDSGLDTLVKKLVLLVGTPERMIYPDRLKMPQIPSQIYSNDTAATAVQVTSTILEFISDRI